ncbi:MFS transporter [Desulfofustis glycolicus]|nr:MFS transporter [Desulfofustis glycolicus]MCB2218572.1 MFS transporter [Desulfobulbaceae bacterium]
MGRQRAHGHFRPQGERLALVMGPVILLSVIFFVSFVARQITGPSLPALEAELGLSHSHSGLFILLSGVGFCLSQLGASLVAARWGYKLCILLSIWGTAAACVLISFSYSVWLLYPLFLAMGMAGGLYVPSGIALITLLVRPQDWGKAMGIHELAPNFALISVPFVATLAVVLGTWRWGYQGCGAALAVLGMLYLFLGSDVQARPSLPSFALIREVASQPSFWQLSILISLAVGVETGVYSMTPLYLVSERGFSLAEANELLGLSRIPAVFLVLLAGWLTDRLNPPLAIAIALAATGSAIIVLGLGPDATLVPAIYIQASASACLFPPILSMASANSSTANRALTLSLSIAVAPVIGGGILPAAIAVAGDLYSFGVGIAAAGLFTLSGIFLVKR